MAAPAIDVIVPTRNNLDALKSCLESIERQRATGCRVIVCADGSSDGTLEYLATARMQMPIVTRAHPHNEHRGRAATRNLALPALEAPYVLLLDSDMRLATGAIDAHLRLLGGRACISVGSIRYLNARDNLWARYLMTRGTNRFSDQDELPFHQFVTANSAMRREDLVSLGGFDERFVEYGGEDTEFAYRLSTTLQRPFVFNRAAAADASEDKTREAALEQLHGYGEGNLHLLYRLHPAIPAQFMTDRLRSSNPGDVAFRAALHPLVAALVERAVRIAPFAIQRRLIAYQVIRAVATGVQARDGSGSRYGTPTAR